MSQDNPNSQPEPRINRRTKPQKPAPSSFQPFWKVKIIQILRETIGVLETTVVKLETEPAPGTEETPGFWSGLLGKIRAFLPASLSAKLSDTALTGVIAGIVVLLVWTSTNAFTQKPPEVATLPPSEEKTVPPAQEIPPASIDTPPQIETPEIAPPEEITPEPEPIPTPIPTPTPLVELTPEQTLIAAIENQVAQISDRFTEGLIKSIQANFLDSSLTIKISDDWYTLKESQQNKLATEILQRSQELDFSHLEITDLQGILIARSPVVGTEMVIFQRREIS
ncbi:MAG: hypothetical protein KME60_09525 [Cyanomargarita calcarea GSE-NOS-MK-12-04C]|jgi:hypothetical protein|uniref:Uncharacterized protein n=1 Tax=Cyanomargarita calcarea GSE-NOS-MK-12-04C TaxID=2839659 RepID=A0A951QMG6_9CYAN|nr:hypothetical protein [Cyanomargarita calcarea GSE-NOS-MK-12-04C]